MSVKHIGKASVRFSAPPTILATASVVGPKEGEGPLAQYFDEISDDMLFGKKTWEQAQSEIVRRAVEMAVQKASLRMQDINYIFAGDLLNQISGSTYGVRDFGCSYFGLFGACSAIGAGMSLGAMLIDGGFADYVVSSASSHFCSTEKTFRFPLELGTQTPPTSSYTVTGDGAVVLSKQGDGPYVTAVTTGTVVDMGVTDAAAMGAAMAPAAADVIVTHFRDLQLSPDYYDVIATGDLGSVGSALLLQLMKKEGYDIGTVHTDCGLLIFNRETQDVDSGGSGCGCSAATLAGYFYRKLKDGGIRKMLFVPTGALHSVATVQQGESIPAIAHAVAIEA
ncbi:MAG: stage V sporulation protein AD [Firmicutes bacterium]|nr:stage V sporulation protein AD [Bacillota bacterium]